MPQKLNYISPQKVNTLSEMPRIDSALSGWGVGITYNKVTTTITDGDAVRTLTEYTIIGALQPMGAKELMLKPEGQRAWKWFEMHDYYRAANLSINDQIVYDGVEYKVLAVRDYKLNNYMAYHLVQDFEEEE